VQDALGIGHGVSASCGHVRSPMAARLPTIKYPRIFI
jgi:hypothetical protein